MKYILLLMLTFFVSTDILSQQRIFLITNYGAKPDSKTNNAKAIQACIDAASKTGNAKVIVPSGYFLPGPLTLKSVVELHLNDGAVLSGSTHRMDYGDTNALPLIGAKKEENISVTGKGIIIGQGRELVKDLIHQLANGILEDKEWKIKRSTEKTVHILSCLKNAPT
jgi:polygalacturonase